MGIESASWRSDKAHDAICEAAEGIANRYCDEDDTYYPEVERLKIAIAKVVNEPDAIPYARVQPVDEGRVGEIRERWANVPMMGVGIWEDGDSLYEEQEPHRIVGYLHKQIDRDVAIALSKSKADIDYLLSLLPQLSSSEPQPATCPQCGYDPAKWVTIGTIHVDIETETETFTRTAIPTESSERRCGECGHADELDPRGRCISLSQYWKLGPALREKLFMSNEFHYEFESDEGFMKWLESYTDNWESEYSGNLRAMYQAYLRGMMNGATAVRLEIQNRAVTTPEL
jgi:hypothetical protein